MKLGYALAAVASLALAAPASAATVDVLGTVAGTNTVFANLTPATHVVDGVSPFVDVTGTLAGVYKDVYAGVAGLQGVQPFNSITEDGTMTYILDVLASSFRMIWGTVDAGNTLELTYDDDSTETVTGQDVLDAPGINVSAGRTNVVVDIFAATGRMVKSVTLTSPNVNSFEHAFNPPRDIDVAPIPVPAAGLLLLTAVGGMGFIARRRKSA